MFLLSEYRCRQISCDNLYIVFLDFLPLSALGTEIILQLFIFRYAEGLMKVSRNKIFQPNLNKNKSIKQFFLKDEVSTISERDS